MVSVDVPFCICLECSVILQDPWIIYYAFFIFQLIPKNQYYEFLWSESSIKRPFFPSIPYDALLIDSTRSENSSGCKSRWYFLWHKTTSALPSSSVSYQTCQYLPLYFLTDDKKLPNNTTCSTNMNIGVQNYGCHYFLFCCHYVAIRLPLRSVPRNYSKWCIATSLKWLVEKLGGFFAYFYNFC